VAVGLAMGLRARCYNTRPYSRCTNRLCHADQRFAAM